MRDSSILNQKKFWDIVKYLVDLDQKKSANQICDELDISSGQLNSFIHFLKEVDCQLETTFNKETLEVAPAQELPKINLEFTLLEWLQFQAHFPAISSQENKPFHGAIKEKFLKVEKDYQKNDMYLPLQTIDKLYHESNGLRLVGEVDSKTKNKHVEQIEKAILSKSVLNVWLNEKEIKIYPRKILYFEGDFNLFGEGVSDSSLMNINISKIKEIEEVEDNWKEVFSQMELDDFVSSLRSMTDATSRLVLKIYSYENFNLNLDYQFFENPCVFSNADGEHIWAATIEQNDKIFEWLYQLGADVEILDPKDFKREFLKYCENKLKKLA